MSFDKPLIDQLGKPNVPVQREVKKKKQYFTSAECRGCQYKATAYCWRNCSMNVWKERRDY
ncbi:MAG: hypothetical protein WC325_09100 [Candidatus Bathyarchaeia archaeon]|jgi:lipopolysaccharide biosynthesis regulator YciM